VRLTLNEDLERLTAKYILAQTDTVLKSVPAGKRFVVTEIDVFCDNGCTVDVQVVLEFDAATNVKIVEHPGVAPGSGFAIGDGGSPIAIGDDGADVLVTVSAPTSGYVCIHVTGYLTEA